MRTVLTLPFEHDRLLPDGYADEVRTPVAFVERFLAEFSAPGDVVLDPFAGFGTTLQVAERLDRVAYGVEYESDRAALVADAVDRPDRVIEGDARALSEYDLPPVDCCLTSPPFTIKGMASDPSRTTTWPARATTSATSATSGPCSASSRPSSPPEAACSSTSRTSNTRGR